MIIQFLLINILSTFFIKNYLFDYGNGYLSIMRYLKPLLQKILPKEHFNYLFECIFCQTFWSSFLSITIYFLFRPLIYFFAICGGSFLIVKILSLLEIKNLFN